MSPLAQAHDQHTRRLLALLAEHHTDVSEQHTRRRWAQELDQADAGVSHCPTCHDWRWHATRLPCQGCGAPPATVHRRAA